MNYDSYSKEEKILNLTAEFFSRKNSANDLARRVENSEFKSFKPHYLFDNYL
jgi:hypothetical protein